MKRFTLLTNNPKKQVIQFTATSNHEAKEKGKVIAAAREVEPVFIVEGWTTPVGYTTEEEKEIIRV